MPLKVYKIRNFLKSYIDLLLFSISVILAGIFYFILHGKMSNSDLIQVFIAYFTFLVLIFSVLIRDIANNYRDRPIVDIEFNPRPPDCHLTTISNGIPALYLRFRVKNVGKSVIRKAEVIVEKVTTNANAVENFLPLSLTWALTEAQGDRSLVSIPQGGFRTVDLLELWEKTSTRLAMNQIPSNTMDYKWFGEMHSRGMRVASVVKPNTLSDFIGSGSHILYISILADNIPPYFVKFEVNFDGAWTQTFENEHLNIKLIEKGDSRSEVFD